MNVFVFLILDFCSPGSCVIVRLFCNKVEAKQTVTTPDSLADGYRILQQHC